MTKEESAQEYVCSHCKSEIKEEDTVCPSCGADLTIDDEREKIIESYKTKTFLGYGKFISVFGVIIIVGGVIAIVLGLGEDGLKKESYVIGGFVSILSGIGFIIYSHFIYCLSSIEKNTRELLEVVKAKNKS